MAKITSEEKKANSAVNVNKLLKQAQFHGLNKFEDAKYRWAWIIFLVLLLTAALSIASGLILRFLDQPTYIVRKEEGRIFMEFPSVQICPQLAYPEYKINQFLSQLKFPEKLNDSYVKGVIQQLGTFYSPDVQYKIQDLSRIQFLLEFNKIDVYTAGKMLTVSCEETLLSEILQYGIHKVKPRPEYHTLFTGYQASLMVAVNQSIIPVDVDLDYKWIIVDGGHIYIEAALNGTPLSPGVEMWLGHKNEGFDIDLSAVSLDLGLRGCKLTDEGLAIFPVYHKKYCQLECEMWYLYQRCKCILLTHPVLPNIPTCGARLMPCAKHAMERFNKGACPCVHTCDVATDHIDISSFRLMHHTAHTAVDTFYHGFNFSKISVVRVFVMKRDVKTKSRRSYYSYEDLFAQLGGIFNVFFGCSLLSILEILQLIKYAFKNWREDRKKMKKYDITNKQEIKKPKNQKVDFKRAIMKRIKQRKQGHFH